MSADRGTRAARWRRWVCNLPVIAALLLAAPAPADTASAVPGSGRTVVPVAVLAAVAEPTLGQRPDITVLLVRATPGTAATDGPPAWLPARGMVMPAGTAVDRAADVALRAQAPRDDQRQRGPPGPA